MTAPQPLDSYAHQICLDLTEMARAWMKTGRRPRYINVLASQQRTALILMAGRERELHAPIRDFLLLDPFLQSLVLQFWDRPGLIGMRLGG